MGIETKKEGSGPHRAYSLVRKANFKQQGTSIVGAKEGVQGALGA